MRRKTLLCFARLLALGLLPLCLAGRAAALRLPPGEFDWGPLASRLSDPAGGTHVKVLGPLFEVGADQRQLRFWAVRPFCSAAAESEDKGAGEFLWPVSFAWDFRENHSIRILTSFLTDFDRNDPGSRWHWWLFPFWFQGRDAQGRSYAALFPFGGTIHDFLGQDEVDFVLFPIYGHSRFKDEDSYQVLWPVFCRENSDRNDRFRVWPLYGWNIRRGEFDKRFCLWPIFNWVRYDHPGASGYGYLVFPLWGHIKRENQEAWMILPPFFKYGAGGGQSMGYMPWPFIQWSSGQVDKFYLWPLWGYKNEQFIHSGFYLWPLGWWKNIDRANESVHRYTFAPLWFSESAWRAARPPPAAPPDTPAVTNCVSRYWHLWPLCSYERLGDQARFRSLFLWPLRRTAPVEREYAPVWTIYQHTRAGGNADDEVLWGLLRHQRRGATAGRTALFPLVEWSYDRETQSRDWALLKGLVGYERAGPRKAVRVLWFLRFGRAAPEREQP